METFQWVQIKFYIFVTHFKSLYSTKLENLKETDKFVNSSDLSKFNAKLR